MENVHEETRKGLNIKIWYEQDIMTPQEWGDNNLFLVGYHRDFSVDAPQVTWPKERWQVAEHKSVCTSCGQRNFTSVKETGTKCGRCGEASRIDKTYYSKTGEPMFDKEDLIAYMEGEKVSIFKDYHVFPLEAYIHSGVVLALSREGEFPDRQWDVSQLGAVLVSKKEARTKAKARKLALSLIESWNDCLSGNVYGYDVEDAEGNNLHSCGNFIGDYDSKGGALDCAREEVDNLTNNGQTDEHGQELINFIKA
jgi:predicted RNA-binding Zn-ribbon protein involved in translation (DUF1610 family)